MIKVRNLLAILAALLVVPVFAGTASAHVEMTPSEAPAGKPVDLELHIGHGCDGKATTGLVVGIPPQASDATALPIEGWKARTKPGLLTWSGGNLPDHHEQVFPFRATLSGKQGQLVMFKAVQDCGSVSTAWIQPVKEGAAEPEYPAPAVTLTSTAAAPAAEGQAEADQTAEEDAAATGEPSATDATSADESSDDDGGSGKSLLLIIVVGLAIGTVAGIVVRSRRGK